LPIRTPITFAAPGTALSGMIANLTAPESLNFSANHRTMIWIF
jgi:hypothetical protein